MITNSDCTIYSRNPSSGEDTWTKHYIPGCWWFLETKSTITTDGLKSADVLTVRIENLPVLVKKGDYVVKGDCPVEMQTIKDLSGYEYFKVVTANCNGFGDNPHIKVVGA